MFRKKLLPWLLIVCMLGLSISVHATVSAAEDQYRLVMPDYSIRMNGTVVDNAHMRYPFFAYHDVTYMPLTWEVTKSLGLNVQLLDAGLAVEKELNFQLNGRWYDWKKERYPLDLSGGGKPNRILNGTKPDYAITVNGETVDNDQQAYPFLVWEDITYMPLTWSIAHDKLGLGIRWDGGLELIGGQQQILEKIYYDDADYLYIRPAFVTKPWQGSLKVKKSMDAVPEWMTVEETESLDARIREEKDKLAGEPVTLTQQEDGLYYEGLKLLTKEQITVDPKSAGNPTVEWSGSVYPLGDAGTFLTVTKRTRYDYNAMTVHYSFLIRDGQAKEAAGFPQPPDRVIPNPDGSFWLASNGTAMMHGRIIPGSRRLALVTPQGDIRVVNDVLKQDDNTNYYDILAPGADNPNRTLFLNADGKLMVYISPYHNNPRMNPTKRGYYWIDTTLQLSRIDSLDQLAVETTYMDNWPVYTAQDGTLYLIRRNNDLANYSADTSVLWYDEQLLVE